MSKRRSYYISWIPCSLLLIMFLPVLPATAEERTIWEIGKFDQSSVEFNSDLSLDSNSNPIFIVGHSTPAKDWPALQPGSAYREAGGRPRPYTIQFTLDAAPQGAYRLTISVLLYRSRVPNLQVEINGHPGLFYFNRRLSYYPGDFGVDSPIYGGDQLEITLPTVFLRAGENKLVLTAMDDPKDGEGESLLAYDALRLTEDRDAKPVLAPQVAAEPTVLYTKTDGQLRELTYITVTLNERVRQGEVALTVGNERSQGQLSTGADFGQQQFD